jgi:hypothetical protein
MAGQVILSAAPGTDQQFSPKIVIASFQVARGQMEIVFRKEFSLE